jgi:hypothetical protein
VLARACAAMGRAEDALQASAEAMDVLEELGGLEEFESLVRLARVEALLAAGDRAGAVAVTAVARARVEERAAVLPEPRWRESFVAQLPENREIMELAERLPTA